MDTTGKRVTSERSARPRRSTAPAVACFLVLAAGSGASYWWLRHAAFQPQGRPVFVLLSLVAFLVSMTSTASIGLIGLVREELLDWRSGIRAVPYLVLSVAVMIPTLGMPGRKLKTLQVEAAAVLEATGAPLVAAVEAYVQRHGQPPRELDALVPGFLPRIPATGLGGYPRFDIVTCSADKTHLCGGNAWMLQVQLITPPFGFDQAIYLPDGHYPEYGWGGYLERLGRWAYVHE